MDIERMKELAGIEQLSEGFIFKNGLAPVVKRETKIKNSAPPTVDMTQPPEASKEEPKEESAGKNGINNFYSRVKKGTFEVKRKTNESYCQELEDYVSVILTLDNILRGLSNIDFYKPIFSKLADVDTKFEDHPNGQKSRASEMKMQVQKIRHLIQKFKKDELEKEIHELMKMYENKKS